MEDFIIHLNGRPWPVRVLDYYEGFGGSLYEESEEPMVDFKVLGAVQPVADELMQLHELVVACCQVELPAHRHGFGHKEKV